MAKGFQAHKQRQEEISVLGKSLSKRAGFACEWCSSKEDLRTWEYQPDVPPALEFLALLYLTCRGLADGKRADSYQLTSLRNALWCDVPAVAEGAARILATCKEPWVREAIEESFISEAVKAELLK